METPPLPLPLLLAAGAALLAGCAPAPAEHAATPASATASADECADLARILGDHDRAVQAIMHDGGQGAAHAIASLRRLARVSRDTSEALRALPSTRADLRDPRAAYVRGDDDAARALADEAETLRAFAVEAMPMTLKLEQSGAELAQTCDKGHAPGCGPLVKLLDAKTDWSDPGSVTDLLDRLQALPAKSAVVEREKQAFVTRARVVLVRSEEATDDVKREQARVDAAGDAMRAAAEKMAAACGGGAS